MRKIIIAALGLLCCAGAMGQVQVNSVEILHAENQARISFNAQVDAKATPRNHKLIMTPVLYNDRESVALPPIVVQTRRTKILDARKGVQPMEGALLTGNGEAVRYVTTVEYGDWMQGSSLRFDLLSVGCCSEEALQPLIAAGNITIKSLGPATPPDRLSVQVGGMVFTLTRNATPMPIASRTVAVPMDTIVNKLEINFRQGSSRLDYYGFNNYRSLDEVISVLRSSQDIVLQGRIEITGYASPEGTQSGNLTLAMNRALAVRNYILDNVHWLRPSNFDIINGGENWDGLYKMVEESNMPGRWQVLDIIDNTSPYVDYYHNNTSRKRMLMNLDRGRTWRYMYNVFFPHLRNAASITVFTPVNGRTSQYPTAVMPPAANADIINSAIDLIGRRDFPGAFGLLRQVESDPRAWNPIGVCYAMDNNMTLAIKYLTRAAEAGYTEAVSNLEQITL